MKNKSQSVLRKLDSIKRSFDTTFGLQNGAGRFSTDATDRNMEKMQETLNDMKKHLERIAFKQRIDGETIRKSANSVNVIVRLLAVCINRQYLFH